MSFPTTIELAAVRLADLPDTSFLDAFDCGDTDLNGFLKEDAGQLQEDLATSVYLAMVQEPLVIAGYITLSCDSIPLEPKEIQGLRCTGAPLPTSVPSLKIGRLATHRDLQKKNGVGRFLVRLAYSKAIMLTKFVGCRLLSVDAYPQSVDFYKKVGFVLNEHRTVSSKSRRNVSMRLDIHQATLPAWLRQPEQDHKQRIMEVDLVAS